MIKSYFVKKLKQQIKKSFIAEFGDSRKLKITAHPEHALMNHSCQFNACNSVMVGRNVAAIACCVVDDDGVIAHFINLTKEGEHIDETLGWSWSGADYRLVKILTHEELKDAAGQLDWLKAKMRDYVGRKWWHKMLHITDYDLS